jgi:glycopeptide antibiotics resistance protein
MKGYEFLTVILPFIIVFLILNEMCKRKGVTNTKGYFLWALIFSFYVLVVFYLTGVGTLFDLYRYRIGIHSNQINLLPFSKGIDIVAYLQNILLFVPFGFLLPFIWPNINKFRYVVLSGFSFSLLIELSQLLNNRSTDVDDLILNTLGAILGYLLFRLFINTTKWNNKRLRYGKYEPMIYIGAMFLGHFLLFNEFGLAKILYNF